MISLSFTADFPQSESETTEALTRGYTFTSIHVIYDTFL